MNVVTPYKNCIPGRESAHGIHSVKVEAHRRYTSPKAELKVHVFLNAGRQQGCKVVTSGTWERRNWGNAVYGWATKALLRRKTDVL